VIEPVIDSPAALAQLAAYIMIQAATAGVDFATLYVLLRLKLAMSAAVAVAYVTGLAANFALNRNVNFRNFERPLHRQAWAYATIAALVLGFTVLWVDTFVHFLHVPPMIAKALSIPVTFVIGFLSNKYVIFGSGLRKKAS
jgi:putative flippase GtrA